MAVCPLKEQQLTEAEIGASMLMQISNAMVRAYKDQFGRGREKARAHWAGPDALIVYLERTLTPAERNLVKLGEARTRAEHRGKSSKKYATVRGFCEPIERITGRKVRGFLSGIDTEVDGLSIESFVLHPKGH